MKKENIKNNEIPLEVTWGEGDDPVAVGDKGDTAAEVADSVPDEVDSAIPEAVLDNGEQSNGKTIWMRLFQSEDLPQLTLREILGGDFLLGTFIRREIWFIMLLVLLGIIYITNRYAAQQEIIHEENLRKELVEKKNFALTRYSELTQQSRQSVLEQKLRLYGDSTLTIPKEPPFIIKK
ncbi:MAG: hypothetical protein K6F94_00085 [Bacteroidaceae bacterium]|nr:hypothetical protein [Bacteroidaceae bacterium]